MGIWEYFIQQEVALVNTQGLLQFEYYDFLKILTSLLEYNCFTMVC